MTTLTPTVEQSAVVDYPLRPLRISAGAGTGKTTTMAMRLASLIERERIDPEAALGITFTNKAAEELTDRLRHHLPDLAKLGREVEVTTYHGFAYGILSWIPSRIAHRSSGRRSLSVPGCAASPPPGR